MMRHGGLSTATSLVLACLWIDGQGVLDRFPEAEYTQEGSQTEECKGAGAAGEAGVAKTGGYLTG